MNEPTKNKNLLTVDNFTWHFSYETFGRWGFQTMDNYGHLHQLNSTTFRIDVLRKIFEVILQVWILCIPSPHKGRDRHGEYSADVNIPNIRYK